MAENTIDFMIRLNGGSSAAEDARKVGAAVESVGGKMRKTGDESIRASKHTGAFGNSLKHLAVGLGAVGAGYAAWNAAKGAIEFTAELAKNTNSLSKATHMSVGQTSGLIAVSGALGVESNKLGMLFAKLGKATVAQAEHTGTAKTAFDRLGISQKEAKGHLNDTAGMLDLVTHKLATEHIPAGEKAALMTELFGKGWKALAPLLLEGEVGFSKLTKMAKEFGLELGGNGAESLKRFHEQQIESKLAMEGLQVSFTKLVAGPLGSLLSGFAKLTVYARKGEWGKFNAQVDQMAHSFENLAEKVMPRVAESFARVAPAVLKAFWKGFVSAPLGTKAVLGLALATKFGLTGGIFRGIGQGLGKSVAGGMIGQRGAAEGVGSKLGGFFGKAFIAAAIAAGIYSFLKNSDTEEPLSEAFHSVFGGETNLEKKGKAGEAAERKNFWKHHNAELYDYNRSHDPYRNLGKGRAAVEAYDRAHHTRLGKPIGKAAFGGTALTAGLVEVGERGREVVHLPQGAQVQPLRPGSLHDDRPIIVKIGERVVAEATRRQTLESQAAGA